MWRDVLSFSFSKDNTKSLFTPWKLRSIKYWIWAWVFGSDWYLFPLIVLSEPDFNCCYGFALSWIDKFTTGT